MADESDDFFGDLVSSRARKAPTHNKDVLVSDSEAQTSDGGLLITVTQSELAAMIQAEVLQAVETTFGKFVKSLRTVLGDMGRRLQSAMEAQAELRSTVDGLRDALEGQADNAASRFSHLDAAVNGVELLLQVLRERAELSEAQALLGSCGNDDDDDGGGSGGGGGSGRRNSSRPGKQATTPTAAAAAAAAAAPAAARAAKAEPLDSAASSPPALVQPAGSPTTSSPSGSMQSLPQAATPAGAPAPAAAAAAAAPPPVQPTTVHAPVQVQYQPQPQPQQQPSPQQQLLPPPPQQQQQQYPAYTPQPAAGPPGGFANPAPLQYQQPQPQPQHHQRPLYQQPPQQHLPQHLPQQQQQQQQQPWHPAVASAVPTYPQPRQQAPPAYGSAPNTHAPAIGGQLRGSTVGGGPAPQQYAGQQQRGAPVGGSQGGGGAGARTSTRAVPLDQVISDICAMGFERRRVRDAISDMQRRGEAIDLNVIIDKLSSGRY